MRSSRNLSILLMFYVDGKRVTLLELKWITEDEDMSASSCAPLFVSCADSF